jgi:hypothetical protein
LTYNRHSVNAEWTKVESSWRTTVWYGETVWEAYYSKNVHEPRGSKQDSTNQLSNLMTKDLEVSSMLWQTVSQFLTKIHVFCFFLGSQLN